MPLRSPERPAYPQSLLSRLVNRIFLLIIPVTDVTNQKHFQYTRVLYPLHFAEDLAHLFLNLLARQAGRFIPVERYTQAYLYCLNVLAFLLAFLIMRSFFSSSTGQSRCVDHFVFINIFMSPLFSIVTMMQTLISGRNNAILYIGWLLLSDLVMSVVSYLDTRFQYKRSLFAFYTLTLLPFVCFLFIPVLGADLSVIIPAVVFSDFIVLLSRMNGIIYVSCEMERVYVSKFITILYFDQFNRGSTFFYFLVVFVFRSLWLSFRDPVYISPR